METQDERQPAPWVQEPIQLSGLPESFRIVEGRVDGQRVMVPCGELDLSNAAQLERRLAGRIDTVLDLSKLSFIDSTGIHLVVSTDQRAQLEGWKFIVRNPQPPVLHVFKLVGLHQHFGLEEQNGTDHDGERPFPAAQALERT